MKKFALLAVLVATATVIVGASNTFAGFGRPGGGGGRMIGGGSFRGGSFRGGYCGPRFHTHCYRPSFCNTGWPIYTYPCAPVCQPICEPVCTTVVEPIVETVAVPLTYVQPICTPVVTYNYCQPICQPLHVHRCGPIYRHIGHGGKFPWFRGNVGMGGHRTMIGRR